MGATICCFMLGSGQGIIAQKVVFPQTQQAGTASIAVDGNEYTLKNNLLTAKFVKQDGSLFSNGCEEMNLRPALSCSRWCWATALPSLPHK